MSLGSVVGLHVKAHTPGEPGLPKVSMRRVDLYADGVGGDYNDYRQNELHGDPDSAVLLLPREVLDDLVREGWPVRPGDLGENIGTRGVPWSEFRTGRTIRVGNAELESTRECTPCSRLAFLPYVGDERLAEFLRVVNGRRGWYGRVVSPGAVAIGDAIEID